MDVTGCRDVYINTVCPIVSVAKKVLNAAILHKASAGLSAYTCPAGSVSRAVSDRVTRTSNRVWAVVLIRA